MIEFYNIGIKYGILDAAEAVLFAKYIRNNGDVIDRIL